jgi:hypothetical protein
MQTRFLVPLLAVWTIWPAGPATAESPQALIAGDPWPAATSRVSVVKREGGQRTLEINYPWEVHSQPSVEIRLVTGKDPGPTVVRPMFFLADYLHGKLLMTVSRAQIDAYGVANRQSLSEKGLDFEVLASRNRLGRPSVALTHRFGSADRAPGSTALYCLLSQWALDKQTLYLDLPQEDFGEPGRLYVWFLREHSVVWSETLDWAGEEAVKHE